MLVYRQPPEVTGSLKIFVTALTFAIATASVLYSCGGGGGVRWRHFRPRDRCMTSATQRDRSNQIARARHGDVRPRPPALPLPSPTLSWLSPGPVFSEWRCTSEGPTRPSAGNVSQRRRYAETASIPFSICAARGNAVRGFLGTEGADPTPKYGAENGTLKSIPPQSLCALLYATVGF